jgi:hypothetical protein
MSLERAAMRVQINALIQGWQRDELAAREAARRLWSTSGEHYNNGTADTLDRCVQALKMLVPDDGE